MTTKLHVTLKKSLCSEPSRAIKPKCFAYLGINPLHPAAGGRCLGFVSGRFVCFMAALVSDVPWKPAASLVSVAHVNSHPSPKQHCPREAQEGQPWGEANCHLTPPPANPRGFVLPLQSR